MTFQDLPYTLQSPLVDPDDIAQEARIFEWQTGKQANKKFIAQRLSTQLPSLIYHGDISYARTIPLRESHHQVVAQITQWATNQSQRIQDQIQLFLQDGSEQALQETLELLRSEGLLAQSQRSSTVKEQSPSFTRAILSVLNNLKRKVHKSELYAWAQREHNARRPDATVRQALRTLVRQGKIIDLGAGYYQAGDIDEDRSTTTLDPAD